MNEDDLVWRGLHVYYRTAQDELLLDAVRPLVRELTGDGTLRRFFFLRYWRGGLHVRLRFQIAASLADAVCCRVHDELAHYVGQRPSMQPIDEAGHAAALRLLADLEREQATGGLVEDNTVHEVAYVPEYDKYGGVAGVALAEDVFHHSSGAVFAAMDAVRERAAQRLGLAYRMMLAGLRAAGLPEHEWPEFLGRYCRFWLRYVPEGGMSNWERRLVSHGPALAGFRGVEPMPTTALADAVDSWAHEVGSALRTAAARPDDVLAYMTMPDLAAPAGVRVNFLLLNYLHTHNNRFGVPPAHEAYLAFLGHRVLAERFGTQPEPALGGVR